MSKEFPSIRDVAAEDAAAFLNAIVGCRRWWTVLCTKAMPRAVEFAVDIAEAYFADDVLNEKHGFLYHPDLCEVHLFHKDVLTLPKLRTYFIQHDLRYLADVLTLERDIIVPVDRRSMAAAIRLQQIFVAALRSAGERCRRDPAYVQHLADIGLVRA